VAALLDEMETPVPTPLLLLGGTTGAVVVAVIDDDLGLPFPIPLEKEDAMDDCTVKLVID